MHERMPRPQALPLRSLGLSLMEEKTWERLSTEQQRDMLGIGEPGGHGEPPEALGGGWPDEREMGGGRNPLYKSSSSY